MSIAIDIIKHDIKVLETERDRLREQIRNVNSSVSKLIDKLFRIDTLPNYEQLLLTDNPRYLDAHLHTFEVFDTFGNKYYHDWMQMRINGSVLEQYSELLCHNTMTLVGFNIYDKDAYFFKSRNFSTTVPVIAGDILKININLLDITNYPNHVWPNKWGNPFRKTNETASDASECRYTM